MNFKLKIFLRPWPKNFSEHQSNSKPLKPSLLQQTDRYAFTNRSGDRSGTVVVVITEKRREIFWKSEKFLKNFQNFVTFNVNEWIKFAFWSSLYKLRSMYNFAAHPIRHFNTFTSGGPKFQLKSQTQNEEWTLGIFVDENLMVTWCSIIGESSYVLELSYG